MAFFITHYLIICLSALIFSVIGTGLAVRILRFARILDVPNARSNHKEPIPRGGGVGVIFSIVCFLMVAGTDGNLLWAALLLATVSFIDDWHGLPARIRLGAQLIALVLAVNSLQGQVFQEFLPWWLDAIMAVLLWLWIINLTNFMDGIDGITAAQVISICLGLILLRLSVPDMPKSLAIDAGIIASASLGFAFWNWHPARIFLGDVGSITLGFLIGYLLLSTAEAGYWQAALILPAYYISDASLTLLKRLLRGEKIWQSHSQHAYQAAARAGRAHDAIVRDIIGLNIVLIVLAIISTLGFLAGWVSIAVAYGLSFGLMQYFKSTISHPFYAPPLSQS